MNQQTIQNKKIQAAFLAKAKNDAGIPTIVCLCGSTRFLKEYTFANAEFTSAGKIVLSVGMFGKADDLNHQLLNEMFVADKGQLDDLHKRKIDLADEVYVINVNGYIGDSTRSEIEYARLLGKPITYMHPQLLDSVTRETDEKPEILEQVRKEAGAEPCLICMDIGKHSTLEHQALVDIAPARSAKKSYDDLLLHVHVKLADALADQPEGLFNDPNFYNISIIDRAAACINRFKKATRTFWQEAKGCQTFAEREELLNQENQDGK